MTHTPAPWMYDDKNTRITAEDGQLIVAEIRGWGRLQYRENGAQTQDANGLLIAAAPDLLAALEEMAAQHYCGCNHPACWGCKRDEMCKQAIAKAKGEQSE